MAPVNPSSMRVFTINRSDAQCLCASPALIRDKQDLRSKKKSVLFSGCA